MSSRGQRNGRTKVYGSDIAPTESYALLTMPIPILAKEETVKDNRKDFFEVTTQGGRRRYVN